MRLLQIEALAEDFCEMTARTVMGKKITTGSSTVTMMAPTFCLANRETEEFLECLITVASLSFSTTCSSFATGS